MKILKPGKIRSNTPKSLKFRCSNCGCKFVADIGECDVQHHTKRRVALFSDWKAYRTCKCPTCGVEVMTFRHPVRYYDSY